jgi:hypothetical protein
MENQTERKMTAMEQIKQAQDMLAQAIERAVGEMQDRVSAQFTALREIKQGLKASKDEMTELENVVAEFGSAMVVTSEDLAERVADIEDVLYVISPEDYEDEDEDDYDEPYEEDEEDESVEEDSNVPDGYYEDDEDETVESQD